MPAAFSTSTICRPASGSPFDPGGADGRRRQVVAAERRDAPARALFRPSRTVATRARPPEWPPFDGVDLVDVVDVQNRDGRRARARGGR